MMLSIVYLGHRRGILNEPVLDGVRVRHMGPGLAPCGDQARPGDDGIRSFAEGFVSANDLPNVLGQHHAGPGQVAEEVHGENTQICQSITSGEAADLYAVESKALEAMTREGRREKGRCKSR